MKRDKKVPTIQVALRVPETDLEIIDAQAAHRGMSRSEYLRWAGIVAGPAYGPSASDRRILRLEE